MISLVAIVSIIAGGFYWFAGAAQKPREDRFRPVAVTQGTVEEVITAQGKLEPKEYVDVGTQVSGQLKQIHVEIGDTVTKGHLLAEIDPRVYETRVEADQARLKSLKAQLNEQKFTSQAQLRNGRPPQGLSCRTPFF